MGTPNHIGKAMTDQYLYDFNKTYGVYGLPA